MLHIKDGQERQNLTRKLIPTARPPENAGLQLGADRWALLNRRLAEPVECVYDPRFDVADFEKQLEAEFAAQQRARGLSDDSGVHGLRDEPCYSNSNLSDERRIFACFNFYRYQVIRILEQFAGQSMSLAAASALVAWEARVVETREEIIRANLPLVLAMAKRMRIPGIDYSELISEGNMALLRSVDKFDLNRGFRFSTYACRAILKSFSRVAVRTSRYRGHFPTEFDPALERTDVAAGRRSAAEAQCVTELKSILSRNLAELSDVEQQVIRARFAIAEPAANGEPGTSQTLEQVGEVIGVTKERVRQIQNKALAKLRHYLEQDILS
jgi:RNA polymerase sigma factor (sigma-70 family)